MPAPEDEDVKSSIRIAAVMVPHAAGATIKKLVKSHPAAGVFGKIIAGNSCVNNAELESTLASNGSQAEAKPVDSISDLLEAGELVLAGDTDIEVEFIAAQFGSLVSAGDARFRFRMATPTNGCAEFQGSFAGQFVVVDRGGCSYIQKVRMAQAAEALGVVVLNNVHGLVSMPFSGDTSFGDISIPAVMVPHQTSKDIRRLLKERVSVEGQFRKNPLVKYHWADLEAFLNKDNWPADPKMRRRIYFKLSKAHHPDKPGGSSERFGCLQHAYKLASYHFSGGDEEDLDDILR
jgi:hypothetical protein